MSKTIAELVAEERQAQGLPPRIEDPSVLRKIAQLLMIAEEQQKKQPCRASGTSRGRGT